MKSNNYKQIIFFVLMVVNSFLYSQDSLNKERRNKTIDLYVSVGSQVGFWHIYGMDQVPFHIHVDKKINGKFFMGLGYSRDVYGSENNGYIINKGNFIRQNFRMRLYSYFNNETDVFTGYAGGSIGISKWSGYIDTPKVISAIPTIQLFIGFKANITKRIFNQSEFSIGSPYIFQTSFGYKF